MLRIAGYETWKDVHSSGALVEQGQVSLLLVEVVVQD